jgi:ribosomal protein S18 acetylase RimI-like enzyme
MDKAAIKGTKIRDMEPADADCVAGFLGELNAHEATISADRDPSEQAGKDHFDYLCGEIRSLGGFCLVVELEDKLLGCLFAAPESMPGFFVKPEYRTYGEIHDIYTVPEARGKELARRLIDEAEGRFRKMGLKQVGLYALTGNRDAIGAYERLGFEHYEVFMRRDIKEA